MNGKPGDITTYIYLVLSYVNYKSSTATKPAHDDNVQFFLAEPPTPPRASRSIDPTSIQPGMFPPNE